MAFIILIGASFFTAIANQTTGQTSGGTTQTLYAFTPSPNNCASNWAGSNTNLSGFDKQNGVVDTPLTGLTVKSISFNLCGFPTTKTGTFTGICPITDTNVTTIGIFNSQTGSLVQSFGTVGISSLICIHTGTEGPTTLVTVTGSHLMAANEMVGITFTSSQNAVKTMTGSPNLGTELPQGGVIDCAASCTESAGFALAGSIVSNGGVNIIAATPGLPQSVLTLPLFAVGAVGLVALQVGRKHDGGIL